MTKGRTEWVCGGALALALAASAIGCGEAPAGGDREVAIGAAAAESAGRPAGVPDDYVATPHGWRHRSCVIQLEADETLGQHELHRRDGSRRGFAPCLYPAYDRYGGEIG